MEDGGFSNGKNGTDWLRMSGSALLQRQWLLCRHEKVEAQKQAVRQKKELERRFKLNDGAEPSGEDALADSKAERDPDKHSEDEAGGSDQDEEDEDRLGEAEIAGVPVCLLPISH